MKWSTIIHRNVSVEGETIENKIERITTQKEPITDGAPLIYTDRKDGVLPGYDIRTDRMEVALDAMTTVAKTRVMQREEYLKKRDEAKNDTEGVA